MSRPGLTVEQVGKVADYLIGTMNSEEDALEKALGPEWEGVTLEDLDEPSSDGIFAHVERCTGCEWWFEPGELNEDFECADCAAED